MRKEFLLGATTYREIVFVEMELRDRNGKIEFSASFNTFNPFKYDENYLMERMKSRLDCYDKSDLYDLCESYDCKPSDLATEMRAYLSIEEIIDISLYPNSIEVNGNEWYFESSCCGQHDTREEMEFYVNEKLYNRIIELWDEYHLKEVDESIVKEVNSILDELAQVNEEEWIENYIKENFNC
jgi:hypothetical protein